MLATYIYIFNVYVTTKVGGEIFNVDACQNEFGFSFFLKKKKVNSLCNFRLASCVAKALAEISQAKSRPC